MADSERPTEAKDCATINLGDTRITRSIPLVNGKVKTMFSGQSVDPRALRSDFKFVIPCHAFLPDILNGEAFFAIQPASLWKFHRVQECFDWCETDDKLKQFIAQLERELKTKTTKEALATLHSQLHLVKARQAWEEITQELAALVQYRWWMGQKTFVLTALKPEDDDNLNISQAFVLHLMHEPNRGKLIHSLLF